MKKPAILANTSHFLTGYSAHGRPVRLTDAQCLALLRVAMGRRK